MGYFKRFLEEQKKKQEQEKIARLLYGGAQSSNPLSFVAYPGQAPMGYNKGGVVGEHRKMFRKPGLARQALGILASSGELMNEVQPRMQMAQAGAVNKSLFDQATQMVDSMIASGQAPVANRDAAINNLYRYYENQALMNPRPAAPRMQGYMDPASGPIDTTGVLAVPAAAAQKVSGGIGSMVDSFVNPDSPPPGEALRPQMEEDDTRIERLAKNIGSGLLSTAQLPSNIAKGINRVGSGVVDVAAGPAEEPVFDNPLVTSANAGDAPDKTKDKVDNKKKLGDETANDEVAELQERLEALEKENRELSNLPTPEEKEAIDPFLERYKEMTGNDENDFYQAMMTAGLAIAGGESDDPVMNIARGALAGLQQYSKGKKDRRDSLFLAEIQARKLKAAETPAQVKLLEYFEKNPEALKTFQKYNIKDRSTETERDLVSLANEYGLSAPQARQLQLEIEVSKSYGDTINIAERAKAIKSGGATVTK
jgi:hypothetical protein